ncbi:unnamed protein product [Closterium sp. NIES-65]|nr:unnamed protein product [Closterium sp. NIES-65]
MEDPRRDAVAVIGALVTRPTLRRQAEVIRRCFSPRVRFTHFLVDVASGAADLTCIYQMAHVVLQYQGVRVHRVLYDPVEDALTLYVTVFTRPLFKLGCLAHFDLCVLLELEDIPLVTPTSHLSANPPSLLAPPPASPSPCKPLPLQAPPPASPSPCKPLPPASPSPCKPLPLQAPPPASPSPCKPLPLQAPPPASPSPCKPLPLQAPPPASPSPLQAPPPASPSPCKPLPLQAPPPASPSPWELPLQERGDWRRSSILLQWHALSPVYHPYYPMEDYPLHGLTPLPLPPTKEGRTLEPSAATPSAIPPTPATAGSASASEAGGSSQFAGEEGRGAARTAAALPAAVRPLKRVKFQRDFFQRNPVISHLPFIGDLYNAHLPRLLVGEAQARLFRGLRFLLSPLLPREDARGLLGRWDDE